MKPIFSIITILTTLFLVNAVLADEIYKWESADGVVHYSNRKDEPKAKLAELPPINKADFELAPYEGLTCDKHGGINCQAGPDSDGSVVCFDGFGDASARFAFHCSSPKLSVSDVSAPDERGKIIVSVRNDRSVLAKAPKVTYNHPDGRTQTLKGPDEIPPFEMAEFVMYSAAMARAGEKPETYHFSITCSNCN